MTKSNKFATIFKNIGNAFNIDQREEAARIELIVLAIDTAYVGLYQVEGKVLATSNYSLFELSIGSENLL